MEMPCKPNPRRRGNAIERIRCPSFSRPIESESYRRFRESGRLSPLPVVQGLVEGIPGVELGMVAPGDDLALVEDEDERGIPDRAEAVGDDQHGLSHDELAERILDHL